MKRRVYVGSKFLSGIEDIGFATQISTARREYCSFTGKYDTMTSSFISAVYRNKRWYVYKPYLCFSGDPRFIKMRRLRPLLSAKITILSYVHPTRGWISNKIYYMRFWPMDLKNWIMNTCNHIIGRVSYYYKFCGIKLGLIEKPIFFDLLD